MMLVLQLLASAVIAQALVPSFPSPYFSWDTIPIAFHGANRSGLYNESTVHTLAKYQLVTIEKWYTECGSKHPIQSGPSCDVEKAMYATFNQVKAINPNITNIMVRSMCVYPDPTLSDARALLCKTTKTPVPEQHDGLHDVSPAPDGRGP